MNIEIIDKKETNIQNIKRIKKKRIRILICISTIILIFSISISMIFTYFSRNFFIFVYSFHKKNFTKNPFFSILVIIIIYFLFLTTNCIIFFIIVISVKKRNKFQFCSDYNDRSIFKFINHNIAVRFILSQFLLSFHFCFDIIEYKPILYFSLFNNFILLMLVSSYYPQVKHLINYSIGFKISIFCYVSIELSLLLYKVTISIYFLLSDINVEGQIIIDSTQLLLGIILVSHFKDIIYLGLTIFLQILVFSLVGQKFHKNFFLIWCGFIILEFLSILLAVKNYKNQVLARSNSDEDAKLMNALENKESYIS